MFSSDWERASVRSPAWKYFSRTWNSLFTFGSPPSLWIRWMMPAQVVHEIWEPGVTSKYLMIRLPYAIPFRMDGIRSRKPAFSACSKEDGKAPPGIRCEVTSWENPLYGDSNLS